VFGILDRLNKSGSEGLSQRWTIACAGVGLGALILGILFGLWGKEHQEHKEGG
jgi:hypothetical protein